MKLTILNKTHIEQGGKMVEFAGYSMPIQYQDGMLKEHEWVRSGNVGLFDVSHMGQIILEGHNISDFLSKITPTSFNIDNNLAKYTVLTNKNGGIIDDLIVTKITNEKFFIVINAACKEKDINWIKSNLPNNIKLTELNDRSLIAIQGGRAELILQKFITGQNLSSLPYMNLAQCKLENGDNIYVSRTGYTGEDGFEVSIENKNAVKFWTSLSKNEYVRPIGLGARDSLRLEMGYPLYGHDLDETTSPIEASMSWIVSKDNQNFIGSNRILQEKTIGVLRKRMGIKLDDRGIAREGSEVKSIDGVTIGKLTSGGFSPTLKASIGQAYIKDEYAKIGNKVLVSVRNKDLAATINSVVFVKPKTSSSKK